MDAKFEKVIKSGLEKIENAFDTVTPGNREEKYEALSKAVLHLSEAYKNLRD